MDNADEKLRNDLMQMNKELETSSSITVDDAIERLIRTQKYLDDEVILSGDGDKAFQMAIDALNHQKWIPVTCRKTTDEDEIDKGDYPLIVDCQMPDDDQEILVTNGERVWQDRSINDDGFYLDSGYEWFEDVIAWQPLPEPYKAEENEQ